MHIGFESTKYPDPMLIKLLNEKCIVEDTHYLILQWSFEEYPQRFEYYLLLMSFDIQLPKRIYYSCEYKPSKI